jgi:sugar phosphate isomerase/epimerase
MDESLNRRSFLRAISLGGAGVMTAPVFSSARAWGASTQKKWQMRLSTSSIHFTQLPIEQACERIAKLGFEAIDIWSAHEGCPHLDDVAERLGPEGLKELLVKHQLKLCAFSVYSGGYERYAKLLGGAGGAVAVRGSAGACKPQEMTTRMREFITDLKPLVELAEKYNSHLAIENHGNALLCSLDSLKAFVDINTSPRLGIALAPYHIQTLNASVPEAIRTCGKQLMFFYAWQHSPGSEQLPGVGPTDIAPWLQALADVQYRGYVNPFMHGKIAPDVMSANLSKACNYLKNGYEKIVEA